MLTNRRGVVLGVLVFVVAVSMLGLAAVDPDSILRWIRSESGRPANAASWKIVGELTGGVTYKFVAINQDQAKNRGAYDEATTFICRNENMCFVAFFLPTDAIPRTQPSREFFALGGFKNFQTLATWQANRNTGLATFQQWDCERAGVEGAPLDALCGEGIAEAFSAILSIAGRTGMAKYCGWPENKSDQTLVAAYIDRLQDGRRKEQFNEAFRARYSSGTKGPDDPSSCIKLRESIEKRTGDARNFLAGKKK